MTGSSVETIPQISPVTVDAIIWDGGEGAVIASPTDPFLVTLDGIPVDLLAIQQAHRFTPAVSGCEDCDGGLMAGVAAPMNTEFGIETCDGCGVFDSDLRAAEGLALHLIAQGLVRGLMNVMYIPHGTDPHRA